MNTCPIITPRCGHCGGRLEHFDGESYCPACVRYTLADDLLTLPGTITT